MKNAQRRRSGKRNIQLTERKLAAKYARKMYRYNNSLEQLQAKAPSLDIPKGNIIQPSQSEREVVDESKGRGTF